jgi:hypothetical protein
VHQQGNELGYKGFVCCLLPFASHRGTQPAPGAGPAGRGDE